METYCFFICYLFIRTVLYIDTNYFVIFNIFVTLEIIFVIYAIIDVIFAYPQQAATYNQGYAYPRLGTAVLKKPMFISSYII